VPVFVLVLVRPPVRVRVRVLLELARAAGWTAENTPMSDLLRSLTMATLRAGQEAPGNAKGKSWQS
jgi:hypothetical protein